MHKIAGAMAARGTPREEVKRVAEMAVADVRSIGMALTPCIVPAADKSNFTLGDDEMKTGMGIHGGQGITRTHIEPADAARATLLGNIQGDLPFVQNAPVSPQGRCHRRHTRRHAPPKQTAMTKIQHHYLRKIINQSLRRGMQDEFTKI